MCYNKMSWILVKEWDFKSGNREKMKKRKKSLLKKLGITALVVTVILAGCTYAGFAMYFEDHYFYHTKIGGEDYSYKTPVEAEDLIYAKLQDYSLEIVGRDGVSDRIVPAEIEMEYIFGDSLIQIKQEQKPALWILGLFKEQTYDLPRVAVYKEELLDQKLDGLTFFKRENIRAPSDAYIAYSKEEQKYVIIAAKPGTEVFEEKTKEAVKEALLSLETSLDLEEAGCYKNAAIDEENEELKAAVETANQYASANVTYDWNKNKVVVDSEVIRDWIEIDGNKVELDTDEITEFVEEQAEEYDTYGRNKIFETTDSREIELSGNAYGWKTDVEAETAALIKAVKNGENIEKVPLHSDTQATPGQMEVGDSYVEIDLGNQHLYLYVEGELILESDFVSGNASRGWNTPAGVFGLTYKTKNAVLRGADYETPVSYWMPFNGNIGMHDATWRSAFGGDIYLTNGSHGCINLPYENAKIIYEYVYTGFPVVCYY